METSFFKTLKGSLLSSQSSDLVEFPTHPSLNACSHYLREHEEKEIKYFFFLPFLIHVFITKNIPFYASFDFCKHHISFEHFKQSGHLTVIAIITCLSCF